MLKIIKYSAMLLLSTGLQLAVAQTPIQQVQSLVVFGGSLSDTGRAWRASGYTKPAGPYYFGRYSNGPVWVEYVAKQWHLSHTQVHNLAFAQAKIAGVGRSITHDPQNPSHLWSYSVPDLTTAVSALLKTQPVISSHAMTIIFMGANDLLQSVANKQSPQQLASRMTQVLFQQVQRLQQHGAKQIVIFDLPNIAETPWYHGLKKNKKNMQHFIAGINQLWRQKAKQAGVLVFPMSQFMQTLFAKMRQHGEIKYAWQGREAAFKSHLQPCYHHALNYIDWLGFPCLHPMSYLFFDRLHPTTQGHAYLAAAFLKWVKKIN